MLKRLYLLFFFFSFTSLLLNAQTKSDEEYIMSSYEQNFDSLLINLFHNKSVKIQSKNISFDKKTEFISGTDVPDSIFIKRLQTIPSVIPMSYNQKVRNYIEFYVNRYKRSINVMLSLSEYYFPIFEEILDQAGVPLELKYLTIIESALNPQAVSRAGAAGLWQFMYSTGKHYDLRINSLVDERRDPIKSSVAAANYLRDLYKMYKDWTLAIAAYNCGPGNINKAIRRSGGKTNYWEIYDYLPVETRGYIPAYIAATYVMHYYKEHGIYPTAIDFPVLTDTIMIREDLHLGQISEVLNIPLDELRVLNPQYKNDIIPGKSDVYSLKLPINIVSEYIEKQDSIISYKSDSFFESGLSQGNTNSSTEKVYYTVKKNDSWVKIADLFGVNTSDIKKWNNQRSKKPIAGKRLIIYRNNPLLKAQYSENNTSIKEPQPSSAKNSTQAIMTYKVKKGDTLYKIAALNGTTVDSLLKVNGLTKNGTIKIGQVLKIR